MLLGQPVLPDHALARAFGDGGEALLRSAKQGYRSD